MEKARHYTGGVALIRSPGMFPGATSCSGQSSSEKQGIEWVGKICFLSILFAYMNSSRCLLPAWGRATKTTASYNRKWLLLSFKTCYAICCEYVLRDSQYKEMRKRARMRSLEIELDWGMLGRICDTERLLER
jgi:hypothetical protein